MLCEVGQHKRDRIRSLEPCELSVRMPVPDSVVHRVGKNARSRDNVHSVYGRNKYREAMLWHWHENPRWYHPNREKYSCTCFSIPFALAFSV